MEMKLQRLIFNSINEFLSLIFAFSLIITSLSLSLLCCFQSDSFVEKNLQNYSVEAVEVVNSRLSGIAKETGFPEDLYTGVFDDEGAKIVFSKIMDNFNFGYTTSFSTDEDIYYYFKTGITNYCVTNGVNLTEKEISDYSSLAVDAVNEALGGTSTATASIMNFARSKKMIPFIVVPVVLAIASVLFLDRLNGGRHRKYNFIGMGFSVAGCCMTFVLSFVLMKQYVQKYRFCENLIYDSAISDVTETALKICIFIGIALLIVGFVILFRNYKYFKIKKEEREQVEARAAEIQNEFDYSDKAKEENTEIVSKIDFD